MRSCTVRLIDVKVFVAWAGGVLCVAPTLQWLGPRQPGDPAATAGRDLLGDHLRTGRGVLPWLPSRRRRAAAPLRAGTPPLRFLAKQRPCTVRRNTTWRPLA